MMNGWHLSKINQGYEMTRASCNDNSIELRELNWFEKIIYYFKIKGDICPTKQQ